MTSRDIVYAPLDLPVSNSSDPARVLSLLLENLRTTKHYDARSLVNGWIVCEGQVYGEASTSHPSYHFLVDAIQSGYPRFGNRIAGSWLTMFGEDSDITQQDVIRVVELAIELEERGH